MKCSPSAKWRLQQGKDAVNLDPGVPDATCRLAAAEIPLHHRYQHLISSPHSLGRAKVSTALISQLSAEVGPALRAVAAR